MNWNISYARFISFVFRRPCISLQQGDSKLLRILTDFMWIMPPKPSYSTFALWLSDIRTIASTNFSMEDGILPNCPCHGCCMMHIWNEFRITEIIQKMKKKGQAKCLGEDLYTLSDPRVSNEELSKVCF